MVSNLLSDSRDDLFEYAETIVRRNNAHPVHRMHENSLNTYREEAPKLQDREIAIIGNLIENGRSTARQIVKRMQYDDMNCVRPRLHRLKKLNIVREAGDVVCETTGQTVSTFEVTETYLIFFTSKGKLKVEATREV